MEVNDALPPLRPDFQTLMGELGIGGRGSMPSRPPRHPPQGLQGEWRSVLRGQGMEFDTVREYVVGDEVRHIDWRVTARTGTPHLKLFHQERQRQVCVLVDDSASMHFGTQGTFKNVQAAQVAALIAGAGLASRERVGGMVFSLPTVGADDAEQEGEAVLYPPMAGRQSILRLCHHLCEGKALAGTMALSLPGSGVQAVWERLGHDKSRLLARGTDVIMLSDFAAVPLEASAGFRQALAKCARRYNMTLIAIDDPADNHLPHAGTLTVGHAGTLQEVDTENEAIRKAWCALWNRRRELLQATCRQVGVPLLSVNTHEDAQHILHHAAMQTRGRAAA